MDFLNGNIKSLYCRSFLAAFGSAFIASVYGMVDMAMVGQYQGPEGTAALAVVAPLWNIIYSLGLLMGIGGSVLFSALRGESGDNVNSSNEYFTAALIGCGMVTVLCWGMLFFWENALLVFFGANDALLVLAKRYMFAVNLAAPTFLFSQFLSAFLRNDGNPGLATRAVLCGGVCNILGDYLLVFVLDMGIRGAGIATAAGSLLSMLVMLTHFVSGKNTLRLAKPTRLLSRLREICTVGASAFFLDVAMGILTVLFNRQIMQYLGTDALAVYGIIIMVSTFAQCCGYSIGQAAQPIISVNFGARQNRRIARVLRYALFTAAVFGVAWMGLAFAAPNLLVRAFMTPTAEILAIAPGIIRTYGISFLLLPFNVLSTYYFQAILKNSLSFTVSVGRGLVLSGGLICLLPLVAGANAIWLAMPITEGVIAAFVVVMMGKTRSGVR